MPIPEGYGSIIDALVDQTRTGKVKWKAGATSGSFLVSLGRYSISLNDDLFPATGLGYSVRVHNVRGEEIDTVSIQAGDPDLNKVRSLWQMARRSALSLEDALREIEEELRSL